MSKFRYTFVKNSMLLGNFVSNLLAVGISGLISHQSLAPPTPEVMELTRRIDWFYLPLSFMAVFAATLVYERPIRKTFNSMFTVESGTSDAILDTARRRLLNEPFVLMAFNLSVWLLAAIVYPSIFYLHQVDERIIFRSAMQTLLLGIITVICAFFLLERILQKWMVPVFFPDGRLYAVPKTIRIRIRTRLAALLFACNLIPFIAILAILSGTYTMNGSPEKILELVRPTFLLNAVIFITVGVLVTLLVGKNLTQPFREITQVLKNVGGGDLSGKVRVTSNDEIGYTGDMINEMTEGLKERAVLRHSLELAHEVQQNLLPRSSPNRVGLDIAGRSIYCDQTGGDYFDYLDLDHHQRGTIGVIVGDVSGHGVSSALLMATARAFLRLRAFGSGSLAETLTDVNRQLTRDWGDSGQFMTVFFLLVDPDRQTLKWIRAGHDPAILYDPRTDRFESLHGKGIALGVDDQWRYEENRKTGFAVGQTIVIGTDGIWEACNPRGEMFGKTPLYEILRRNPHASAAETADRILSELAQFRRGARVEDDVTLIVIKRA